MITPETQENFKTLQRAFSRGDVSVVACKDSKGKEYPVLCALSYDPQTEEYTYIPFALMISRTFHPLLNKLYPPENLHGNWAWMPE